jgi:TonB family protein
MRHAKWIDLFYAVLPFHAWKISLLGRHIEGCPECASRLVTREEARRALVQTEDLGDLDAVWPAVQKALAGADGEPYFLSLDLIHWAITDEAASSAPAPILAKEPARAVGEIRPPKTLRKVDPVYPKDAFDAGVEGTVILEAITDIYGRVQSIKVLKSIPMLDQAAIDAIRQRVFEPVTVGGRPRSVVFSVVVPFKLK